MPPRPAKLRLYELAVQDPWTQVNCLLNAYAAHHPGRWATRLREDFCGSAALARAWVRHDHDHQALAIDHHGPTVRDAERQARRLTPEQASRLTIHHADVLAIDGPSADVSAALNFSVCIYHERAALLAYLRHARQTLAPGGMLALDTFGGPGAWRVGVQKRRVRPPRDTGVPAFDYLWEQRDVDPLNGLVDCRIHFRLRGHKPIDNAFVYRWRLWSVPELIDALDEAGFDMIQTWSSPPTPEAPPEAPPSAVNALSAGHAGQGPMVPVDRLGPCEDFVAWITATSSGEGGSGDRRCSLS